MKRVLNCLVGMGLLATAAGCGGGGIGLASIDGGPIGTGISASVSGNVVSVTQGTAAAETFALGAAATIPAVQVTIDEVPGVQGTTDANGNFELEGKFAGTLTLRFSIPTMFDVTERLEVPAGSTIVLEDVELAPGMVRMGTGRQLGFSGVVAHEDCSGGMLLVNDRGPTANQFMVRVSGTTTILDGSGQALECAAVQTGQAVVVRGTIQRTDQTVVALGVVVEPQATDQVQFTGTVMRLDCAAGSLMISDPAGMSGMPGMPGMPDMSGTPGMSGMAGMPGMVGMVGRSRLRLTSSTQFTNAGGQPVQCQDIQAGDDVEVSGVVNSDQPGLIEAQTMKVSTTP